MKRWSLLAAALATPALPAAVSGQDIWPSRNISVLRGYPPGGGTGFAARDPVAALTLIGTVSRTAFILHVHPSLPVRSRAEPNGLWQGQSAQGEFPFVGHQRGEPAEP